MATAKKFFYEGRRGNVTLYTYDITGKRRDLYAINDREEAAQVCAGLNAAIAELMGEESEVEVLPHELEAPRVAAAQKAEASHAADQR